MSDQTIPKIPYNPKIKMLQSLPEDDEWIRRHFVELVNKYAHHYVAVANQEIVGISRDPLVAEREAKKKYPNIMPSVILVPSERDFQCAL